MTDPQTWFEQPDGGLVRPFALVRGRTETGRRDLDVISLVQAAQPETPPGGEYGRIVGLCRWQPLSVAEIAAHLDLPLLVAKVLVGDLLDEGDLVLCGNSISDAGPDMVLLQAVLEGVRRL
ncbi:DUF742 domain-containing protein [Actinophytocola oryzae]|uniref:Uncharacterized protein DUF742 n=1 Tax=Actinophytocola oryzae TaxID=502181 RepID=A0A4V3FUN9_9PSEU|nr:DUF742 domain-containing protein [Actinophytocola oryzae]TDV55961.1 uncharacterized protein DUF742 [Actinophytocola oryzae]